MLVPLLLHSLALSGEKEAISPTFPGSEHTFFLYYERKLRVARRHRDGVSRKIEDLLTKAEDFYQSAR